MFLAHGLWEVGSAEGKKGSADAAFEMKKKNPANAGFDSKSKGSKEPRVRGFEILLREEGRSGAEAAARIVEPARDEPHAAVVEAEDRRAREVVAGNRSVFISAAVGIELIPTTVALGMSERHAANRERAEAELVRTHDLACPANRAAAMPHTELRRDDQDVALLLLPDLLEHSCRVGVLPQITRPQLALAGVVELPLGSDGIEHQLERPIFCQRGMVNHPSAPAGNTKLGRTVCANSKVAVFASCGKMPLRLHLLEDGLAALVLGRVGVGRCDFFVLVLAGG